MWYSDPTRFEPPGGSYAITVVNTSPYSDEALLLVDHLWEALTQLYGLDSRDRFAPEQIDGRAASFLLARVGGQAVGCGVLVPLAEATGEIKRMWVEPDVRRRGIALAILQALEAMARLRGWDRLRLEVGNRQPEAVALFHKVGFQPLPCWGAYHDDPISLCFEKILGRIDLDVLNRS